MVYPDAAGYCHAIRNRMLRDGGTSAGRTCRWGNCSLRSPLIWNGSEPWRRSPMCDVPSLHRCTKAGSEKRLIGRAQNRPSVRLLR